MIRRLSALALISALVAAQVGCHSCASRPGLFTSNTQKAPCQTVGLSGGCFDGATGQPCPCPEGAGVLPGGPTPFPPGGFVPGAGPQPEVLPAPRPSDMIPPSAVPLPAPPPNLPLPGNNTMLPYPTLPGTPVKTGPNK